MSVLPDGSGVLLCPVGPEFSMIGDQDFSFLEDNDNSILTEITPAVFAAWYSNAKKIRVTDTAKLEGEEPQVSTQDYTQWGFPLNPDDNPVYANTGEHPFPMSYYANIYGDGFGVISSSFHGGSGSWFYAADLDGVIVPADLIGRLFIHKDKFYHVIAHFLPPDALGEFIIDDGVISQPYSVGSGSFTREYKILEYFYPIT